MSRILNKSTRMKIWRIVILTLAVLLTHCVRSDSVTYDDLALNLTIDQTQGQVGKTVHIVFTVRKTGDNDIGPIASDSVPVMDIYVGLGTYKLAQWSDQQATGAIVHHLDLKRGESQTIEMIWVPMQDADRNKVLIQGILNRDNQRAQDVSLTLPVGVTR